MEKATYTTTFENILKIISEKGISTQNELKKNQLLYAKFWFALREFCHLALLSKDERKDDTGDFIPGNLTKVNVLEDLGATTRKDIEADCMIKIIQKLDWVLRQSVDNQGAYCYVICCNMVNDCFRKLPPDGTKIVSLEETIEGTDSDSENSYTYADVIGDNTYNGECVYFENEAVKELQAKKRSDVLNDISKLAKRPAEVLVRLGCKHLKKKPRELAKLIIEKGCASAYAKVIHEVAKQNNIPLSEISSIIAGHELTEESVKANTNNSKEVAYQISRLIYRADHRLCK